MLACWAHPSSPTVSSLEGARQLRATLGVLRSQPRGSVTCVQVLQQSPKGHRVDLWAEQKLEIRGHHPARANCSPRS